MNDTMNQLRIQDLVNNPTPRLPVVLCLDTSFSMGAVEDDGTLKKTGETIFRDGQKWELVTGGTSRIQKLQEGIQLFYEAIREDEVAQFSAEICIVTFNSTVKCIVDFATVDRQQQIPEFQPDGETHMGEGVNLALDLLEKRKQEYKDKGVDYYQPWLVLMTDDEANGDSNELSRAINRTTELINNKKLTIFPIGIGPDAGMSTLAKFSPKRRPLRLNGLKFDKFFAWLSDSVSRTSQSMPGENVKLNTDAISDWGTLD